jgi:hypothetical protein
LLVPEPAPRRVLLENIKVAKTLDYTDTDASAPPLLRRDDDDVHLGAFLPPASLHISAFQCLRGRGQLQPHFSLAAAPLFAKQKHQIGVDLSKPWSPSNTRTSNLDD